MKFMLRIFIAALLLLGPEQLATSQQPMEKGTWSFRDGLPNAVTFVYGTKLTAKELSQLSQCTRLTHVMMGNAGIDSEYVTIEGDLTALGKLKNLVELHLCKDGIHDDDLKFIALLPKLEVLEFNADNGYEGAPICTDKSAKHLSAAKTLRSLTIHDGNLTDAFVATITENLHHLETLSLSSSQLTDESLRLISERCNKLKSLSISSENFTVEGLKQLDKMKRLEQRRVISPALRKTRALKGIQ
ncbi:MAG: hypothetical protein CBB71_06100 [Rhodopirellula sp. TMED11]|nr:MAG: hypothetical protein CBB71_06100 [Rhodopirellula sp. TMED11]